MFNKLVSKYIELDIIGVLYCRDNTTITGEI